MVSHDIFYKKPRPFRPAILGENSFKAIQGLREISKNTFRAKFLLSLSYLKKMQKKLNFLLIQGSDQNKNNLLFW